MTTEEHSGGHRYGGLSDYLAVLRRYALLIVALMIIGAGLGYFDAKRQTPVYRSSASVQFEDPSKDLNIVGIGGSSSVNPETLAAAASATVNQPNLLAKVAAGLGGHVPVASLIGAVSGSVSAATGNLQITVTSSRPAFAARVANAVAAVVASTNNHAARGQFAALARQIQTRITALESSGATGTRKATGIGEQLLFYDDELARANTLKQFAKSAQVATTALPPGAPISPSVTRSAILGLVLGLLLGVLAAFLADAFDRRLRNHGDIESAFPVPVLGYVRQDMLGGFAYTNGGANAERQFDIEAFRIMRRNLEFLIDGRGARTIVVTSGLPEEGKTTVAGSLAFALAAAGKRTLLVDCDLRRPALTQRLKLEGGPGMSEFLAGEAEPPEILRTLHVGATANGVSAANGAAAANGDGHPPGDHDLVVVPAGTPRADSAELLGSEAFEVFLAEVSQVYDVVILDSSPLLPVADALEMLPHADGVILCARESQTTRAEARATVTALAHLGDRPVGLVVTGVRPRRNDYASYAYYAYSS